MAVVVEQTIPFSSSTLNLNNGSRWNTLFPLIRPSIKSVQTSKGQNILVDTNKSNGNYVHIIAVGTTGNFSSKLLDDKHVTAIISTESGAGILHATDIPHTLESAGIKVPAGVVVVRAGKERRLDVHQPDIIEVVAQGGLEQDHILQLLGTATETTRTNPHHVSELLKTFIKSASSSHSTFHTEKADGNPAVLHADGAKAYEKAKHAVERDLKHVMKAHTAQKEDVVYSVHFSDVNGLSRLENYIIAGEIANYFGENLNHCLSRITTDHSHLRLSKPQIHTLPLHPPQSFCNGPRLLYLHLPHADTLPCPRPFPQKALSHRSYHRIQSPQKDPVPINNQDDLHRLLRPQKDRSGLQRSHSR